MAKLNYIKKIIQVFVFSVGNIYDRTMATVKIKITIVNISFVPIIPLFVTGVLLLLFLIITSLHNLVTL